MPWLILAALLSVSPEEVAPTQAPAVETLAEEVRSVSPPGVADLVARDPRFAALSTSERQALLGALALDWRWHLPASAANLIVGFGIGSLFEGDLRGLVLTVTDAVAVGFLFAALLEASTMAGAGEGSTSAMALAPAAVTVLVAGRIAGLILPWTWDGRHHAAAAAALGGLPLPPPRPSGLLVAPLVASTTGRAAPGVTLLLRF